jgi:integrase
VVDYSDQHGQRHIKTFARKKDAERYQAETAISVRAGTHAADSTSVTVAEAAKLWLTSAEGNGLERASLLNYRRFADLHIGPLIGTVKLSQLTVPLVRQFEDRLRVDRSPSLVREVVRALGTILADAQERGLVAQNVVRSLRTQRRRGQEARSERRRRGKLKVGVDIPSPDEIRTLIGHLDGRWRPLFLTAIFSGLRASELRGLRWIDVDLKRGEIHVRQFPPDRSAQVGSG